MYFCYIDESGNTGSNLKDVHQPYLVLAALMVPPHNIKEIENDVRSLGYKYFGAESRNTDFEFHGDTIYNTRKKDRYFKKLPLEKRFELLDELVNIIIKHEDIKVGYISIHKQRYFANYHIQQTAFHLLVEKIEERLQGYLNAHCLLIADEQDEIEQKLIDDLDHFKQHGTIFGYKSIQVEKIIDSVHFVQSHNNYLMQLSDVLCYLIRKGKESKIKLYDAWQKECSSGNVPYQDWVCKFGNRGHVYFLKKYEQINERKPFVFSKEFP
jgi:hypothetical protein